MIQHYLHFVGYRSSLKALEQPVVSMVCCGALLVRARLFTALNVILKRKVLCLLKLYNELFNNFQRVEILRTFMSLSF